MEKVLSKIRPTEEELKSELSFASKLISHIKTIIPKNCEVVLTGSVAKKTFLKNKKDVDIFVLFEKSVPREELQPNIRSIMEKAFPTLGYQLSYAEHPYVRFHISGRRVDLVPAYKISNSKERISAVDRSILHTKYVLKNMLPKQRDEVLLLKQFLKSNELYGAEIKIKGFSGYLCELLVLHYGSFKRILKESQKWPNLVIDLLPFYKKNDHKELISKFGSFVVIDPTDRNRNVAAALSDENLLKFKKIAKAYQKEPNEKVFFKEPISFESKISRLSKGKKKLLVSLPRPDVVDDILWGQLYKLIGQLEIALKEFGPKIIADDSRHMVRLAILLTKDKLSKKTIVKGPPVEMKDHANKFKKSHKITYEKKGELFAEVQRPITSADEAIIHFMRKFSKTDSHLACQEELIIIEKI